MRMHEPILNDLDKTIAHTNGENNGALTTTG